VKIDFSQELKTIEGSTLTRSRVIGGEQINEPCTLRWACVEALLAVQADEKLSGEEKVRRYDLALLIQEAKAPLDLSVDDLSFIKKLCDQGFTPLVVGQTRRLLEGPSD